MAFIPSSLPRCEHNLSHVYCSFFTITLDQHESVSSQVPSLPLV